MQPLRLVPCRPIALIPILILLFSFFLPLECSAGVAAGGSAAILDDLKLPTYVWHLPNETTQPKAILLCLHGAVLHGQAYEPLALELAKNDYLVVSLDMRGYGKWYHAKYGSSKDTTFQYDTSIQDIQHVLVRLRTKYPTVPLFCLGESLGANMSLLIASRMPRLIDGIIVVSPFTSLRMYLSPCLLEYAFGIMALPRREINLAHYLKNTLSNNESTVNQHFSDPLNRDRQTISELWLNLKILMQGKRSAKFVPENLPVLFLAGQEDRLVSLRGIKRLFLEVHSDDKRMVVLPKGGHLILETPHVEDEIIQILANWMDSKSSHRLLPLNENQVPAGAAEPVSSP